MNATVNHELRNPINSIVAYNVQKERLYNELRSMVGDNYLSFTELKEKIKETLIELDEGNEVQMASAKIV